MKLRVIESNLNTSLKVEKRPKLLWKIRIRDIQKKVILTTTKTVYFSWNYKVGLGTL